MIQVGSLMWMRTIMNYQYCHGGTFKSTFNTLYKEGGVPRLYKGFGIALLYVPMCRFGDILANVGAIRYMDTNEKTKDLSLSTKTFCGNLIAGVWRISISPIDMIKNTMQVNGYKGMGVIRNKIKINGLGSLYHGSSATFTTCVFSDFPWFIVYNHLNQYFDIHHKDLSRSQTIIKNAFTGLCASMITDVLTNSLHVIKINRQAHTECIGYRVIVKQVIKKDGYGGLFCRGLKTRLVSNGIQSMMFSVLWKLIY